MLGSSHTIDNAHMQKVKGGGGGQGKVGREEADARMGGRGPEE